MDRLRLFGGSAIFACALFVIVPAAVGHGDVQPQPVDTAGLDPVGEDWAEENPYRLKGGDQYAKAIEIGASGYNQNCARCHGLEAISGGISPDLRKFDQECSGLADAAKKNECFKEMDEYYMATVRRGRVRDGRVYMPPFEGTLSQEAIWTIKTYINTRREP